MWSYFFVLASSRVLSGIMLRTSPFIIENKPLQGEARRLRCAPVSCLPCPGAYFPDNDRRSIHYPLHIPLLRVCLCRRIARRSGWIRCQCVCLYDTQVYPISGSVPAHHWHLCTLLSVSVCEREWRGERVLRGDEWTEWYLYYKIAKK